MLIFVILFRIMYLQQITTLRILIYSKRLTVRFSVISVRCDNKGDDDKGAKINLQSGRNRRTRIP